MRYAYITPYIYINIYKKEQNKDIRERKKGEKERKKVKRNKNKDKRE